MTPADIETLERATVHAVSPDDQAEFDGWVLPFDAGTVGRARSAVPLAHTPPDPSVLDRIEAAYAERALPPMLRTPVLPFAAFRTQLTRRGYIEEILTDVCIAKSADVRAVSAAAPSELHDAPNAAWASVFLGEGFDPVDGASRVKKLGRACGSLFATIEDGGQAVAAGAAAFSHGWASVHGMRTAQAHRGRGLAARVLATLGAAAGDRGYERVFLQVSPQNTAANALYRRAGFTTAWSYSYWRRPTP